MTAPELPLPRRIALKKRRAGLGLLVLLSALGTAGVLGPWWQLWVGPRAAGEPVSGPDFVPPPETPALPGAPAEGAGPEGAGAEVAAAERPERPARPLWRPAVVALVALALTFLVASTDLVTDSDVQLPSFVAALAFGAAAAWVARDVFVQNRVVDALVPAVQLEHLRARGTTTGSPDVVLEVRWGLALFYSSAVASLIVSTYLTFVAERAGRET